MNARPELSTGFHALDVANNTKIAFPARIAADASA